MPTIAENWNALSTIVKGIGVSLSPASELTTAGSLVAKGDTYNYRYLLSSLGFEWRRIDRCTVIYKDTFMANDYTRLSITSHWDLPALHQKVADLIKCIHHPFLSAIVQSILMDDSIHKKFFALPAAVSHHHGYPNGLAEHSIQVAESAIKLVEYYASILHLDSSLLIAGALLHDIGKIECYTLDGVTIDTTDTLRHIGHIAKGLEILGRFVERIVPADPDAYHRLCHIIASHQVHKEWDSPVEPQLPEAWIIACADQISAKIGGTIKYR